MHRLTPIFAAAGVLVAGLGISQATAPAHDQAVAGESPTAQPAEVDESALVPALFPGYDWSCRSVANAPVCKGTLNYDVGWELSEITDSCAVPIYTTIDGVRHSTRYYGEDMRLDRKVGRVNETEHFSASDGGPSGLTIRVIARYVTEYDVPGDENTGTQVTKGTQWDMRDSDGRILLRTVGTLVEPYDGPATFTGTVNHAGTVERVVDEPLEEVFFEEWFFAQMCEVPQQSTP